MAKKRQRTVWLARADYKGGTYIRVGRLYNNPGVPADIIRWQVVSKHEEGSHDFVCTIDEALAFIACLSHVVIDQMLPKADKLRRMFR